MTCWIIVPIKAPADCKTRLRPILSDAAREALVRRMLHHVVETARGSAGVDRVLLLGPSRHGLDPATPLLADPGRGLNDALAAARDAAVAAGVDRLVFISADLPRVTTADIQALIAQPTASVGIAPDRAGTGTNALSIPLPQGARFGLHYGPDSLASHSAEACMNFGLVVLTVMSWSFRSHAG